MVLDENIRERRPHVAGVAEAVQHRRALAADAHIDRGAVGLDHFGPDAGCEFFDLRGGGQGGADNKHDSDKAVQAAHSVILSE